jgi:cytochrome P450
MTNCPIQHDASRNVWIASRFADVVRAMRDTETFSAPGTLLGSDEKTHARVRRALGSAFTARQVNALAELVRLRADELAGRMAACGKGDLIADFALPLALSVVGAMLGIDRARFHDLQRWSEAILHLASPLVSEEERARYRGEIGECRAFMTDHVARLSEGPLDPYVAQCLAAPGDGDGLTFSEKIEIGTFLIIAGTEATRSLIGNALLILLREVAWQPRLRADTRVIPAFVEEVLRFDSPVQRTLRRTTRSTELGGLAIPQGAIVELGLAAANRDPERFPEADQFRVGRHQSEHLSFAFGRHLCLGAQLARAEASIAIETIVQRFPALTLQTPEEPIDFGRPHFVRGPTRLDVSF